MRSVVKSQDSQLRLARSLSLLLSSSQRSNLEVVAEKAAGSSEIRNALRMVETRTLPG